MVTFITYCYERTVIKRYLYYIDFVLSIVICKHGIIHCIIMWGRLEIVVQLSPYYQLNQNDYCFWLLKAGFIIHVYALIMYGLL